MYVFYLAGIRLPVTPSKVSTKIKGANRTINLINEGEINQIRGRHLTEFSFECLLPQVTKYSFATYKDGKFLPADYFLAHLKALKKRKTPFRFTINRYTQLGKKGKVIPNTSMLVTLEEYTISEEAENGLDVKVSVNLKEYKAYGKKYYKVIKSKAPVKTKYELVYQAKPGEKVMEAVKINPKLGDESKNRVVPYYIILKKGDTLRSIAKKYLDNDLLFRELYKINIEVIEKAAKSHGRSSSSNGYYLYPGTEIRLVAKEA